MSARFRILFVAEDVTLAQVVRLATLAKSLDESRYEVHFASATFDERIFAGTRFKRWELFTIDREKMMRAVKSGKRLYGPRILRRYIQADQAILEACKPDLVVGDLRWSLAVSAPLTGTPYAAVINAYWSPYAVRERFPLPEHPIVRWLGEARAAEHFPKALPFVFRHFAKPLNSLRKRHGLTPIGSLLEVLTFADHTLYLDPPELVPIEGAPASHRFLGMVGWAPDGTLPPDWGSDAKRPPVYVTLGSSGVTQSLPVIAEALASLNLDVLVATAGRVDPATLPRSVRVTDYAPGDQAAARARFVVSNGGSTTGYQALSQGAPVLGVPFNLDQYLATQAIEKAELGLHVRSGAVTPEAVVATARRLLDESHFRQNAQRLQKHFDTESACEKFHQFLEELQGPQGTVSAPQTVSTVA